MSEFSFPWQYHFAPFFTLQPHAETRAKQLAAWRSIVLDYCQHKAIAAVEVKDLARSPLFNNAELGRRLDEKAVEVVLDELCAHGHLEWLDKGKLRAHVFYRTSQQWGEAIYAYAKDNGLAVCTMYELTESEEVEGQPFHNLDQEVLVKALKTLEVQKKAEIFGNNEGVKFF
jgi:ESCRT-II complex subunit VPS25